MSCHIVCVIIGCVTTKTMLVNTNEGRCKKEGELKQSPDERDVVKREREIAHDYPIHISHSYDSKNDVKEREREGS